MGQHFTVETQTALTPSLTLRDVAAVLFRQRRLFIATFSLIFMGTLLWGIFVPSYKAEMKVLVRRGRLDPVMTPTPTQSPLIEDREVTEEELNSEVELIQDQDILGTVVSNSGLLLGWSLPWNLGGSDEARMARAVRRLAGKLNVEPVRKSALITVSYNSSNPALAASVLNCLAAAYLDKHQRVRRPSGQFAFFDQQALDARSGLQQAEAQLMDFSQAEGIVSASLERDNSLKKLSDLDAKHQDTEIVLTETRRRVRALEATLKTLPTRATTVVRNSDNPTLLGEMKSRLLDLQLKRTDLMTKFQPSYRVVQEIDQQIADTRAAIAGESQSPVRDLTTQPDPNYEWTQAELVKNRVELSALEARATATEVVLSEYKIDAQKLGDHAIEQEQLLRVLKGAEDKYLLYVNKREEARIGDALDQGGILNVAIAEHPLVPALPIWSCWTFGVIGLFAGTTVGTGLAFSADYLSSGFRTPEEVSAYLGTQVLASLPEENS